MNGIYSWWFQPIWSNWIISPGRGKNKKSLKPPPRYYSLVISSLIAFFRPLPSCKGDGSSPVALGGLAHEMFLQFPLAHTEVIQNASLAPKTAKEPWGDGMGTWHGAIYCPCCFLISTCFLAWRFFWEFLFFHFFLLVVYTFAESVIFETWRLARILFPHHIGAIFDKHLKSNVSIDSNLWNVLGTINKRPVLSVFVVLIFIHSFTSPVCITLMPWEVETTWANTQSMPDYALCISRKHFHSTLCYKHTLTYPITTVHIWNDGVVRIASQLTKNNHLASSSYCTNSKKIINSYKLNLPVPWPIETLFRTVSYIPDLISAPGTHLKTSGCNAKLCFSFSTEQCRFWCHPYLASCLEVVISSAAMMEHSKVFKSKISLYLDLFCCSSSVFFL